MTSDRFPNLFIAGAPKCGTTSLAYYLGQHPEIFAPVVKEPVYFGSDLTARSRLPLEHYLKLYRGWEREKFALDASTHYFYSKRAAEEVAAASPRAEILIILRNPVEAAHSMYHEQRFLGIEKMDSFEAALAAENMRSEELRLLKFGFPENLLYCNIFSYSKNISVFDTTFGRERVHILLLDDLKANPSVEVKRICLLLGIDVDPVDSFSFEIKNAAKRSRFRWLNTLAIFPPPWIKIFSGPFPRSLRIRVRKYLAKINREPATNMPLDPKTKEWLTRSFEEDVRWLSERMDRDLTHWLQDD